MKTCKKMQQDILLYLDNSLNNSKKSSLEKHINNCQECHNYLLEMQSIIKSVKSRDFTIEENYNLKLLDNIYSELEKRERKGFRLKLVSAISTAILIIVILFTGFDQNITTPHQVVEIDIDEEYFGAYLSLANEQDYGFDKSDFYYQTEDVDIDISGIAYTFIESEGTDSYEDIITLSGSLTEKEFTTLVTK